MNYCATFGVSSVFHPPWSPLFRCPSRLARITAKRQNYGPRRAFWEMFGDVCLFFCIFCWSVAFVCVVGLLVSDDFCVLKGLTLGFCWCLPSWALPYLSWLVVASCCVCDVLFVFWTKLLRVKLCYCVWSSVLYHCFHFGQFETSQNVFKNQRQHPNKINFEKIAKVKGEFSNKLGH